jgi:hypothetical protein
MPVDFPYFAELRSSLLPYPTLTSPILPNLISFLCSLPFIPLYSIRFARGSKARLQLLASLGLGSRLVWSGLV